MPDVFTDFDPAEFDVLSDEEAAKALYRPSRESLKLQQEFLRQQENQPDQSSWWERLALGANQGVAGLESSLGGLFDIVGLPEFGAPWLYDARRRSSESEDVGDTLGVNNPWKMVAQGAAGMATQQVPSVVAARFGGLPVAMVTAGLQTAGSVQDQAEQAYEAQGLSRDEAIRRARLPAITSGAITAALTALMPGGTEKLAGMLARTPAVANAARQTLYQTVRGVVKEAAKEAPEEMLDQIGQDVVARFSYDPEKPLDEIIQDAWEAGGWGIGTAGAVGTIGGVAGSLSRARNQAASTPRLTGADIPARGVIPISEADPEEFEVLTPAAPEIEQPVRLSRAPVIEAPPIAEDDFEVIEQPVAVAPELPPPALPTSPAAAPPEIDLEPARRALLENMQGRSMDISPADFANPDAHIRSVLGPQAPSWEVLADAGIIEATPNKNGTINVRVAPQVQSAGLKPDQAEMGFADDAFKLAQETTTDGQRIMQEQAQREADRAVSEAGQLQMPSTPAQPVKLSAAAQKVFDAAKAQPDEFHGADATKLSPEERRALAALGLSFVTGRKKRDHCDISATNAR